MQWVSDGVFGGQGYGNSIHAVTSSQNWFFGISIVPQIYLLYKYIFVLSLFKQNILRYNGSKATKRRAEYETVYGL
jgi:hypothetical protein